MNALLDPLKSVTVLVVEDQLATRGWLCDMLRVIGVKDILTSGDGWDALGVLKDQGDGVDLILCDLMMPRMSGMDLLRRVRQSDPQMPFIMQTGHGSADTVIEARAEGVSAFLVKPFSQAQLESKLRQVMAKSTRVSRAPSRR
jgi:two-component system, chemotaxis family, chemotaxis protein CheY